MNRLILTYRVDPEVAAELLPARIRPRIVNGHVVAALRLSGDRAEYRIADHVVHAEAARLVVEERAQRVYVSGTGQETVDVSVRPAHAWRSELFSEPRAAARSAGVVAAVPVAIDWVRSSYFDRLGATVDCALLLPDEPVRMDLAA